MSCIKFINNFANKTIIQNTILRTTGTVQLRNSSSGEPDWVPKDPVTHTGQKWDKDDYRLARFVDRPKQINDQFAVKLINEVLPTTCKDRIVYCDGGNEHTGHPRVYINLDKPGNHTCGYCGLRFVKEDHHH